MSGAGNCAAATLSVPVVTAAWVENGLSDYDEAVKLVEMREDRAVVSPKRPRGQVGGADPEGFALGDVESAVISRVNGGFRYTRGMHNPCTNHAYDFPYSTKG